MTEKRARPRLKVSMPVQVIGRSIDGEKFRELCQTQDASVSGLCIALQAIVQRGTMLYLSMRMPRRLRLFDLAKDIYQVYAQVQRVQLLAQGGCEVGLSFIGRNPPPGHESYQTVEYLNTDLKMNSTPGFRPNSGAFAMPDLLATDQAATKSTPEPSSNRPLPGNPKPPTPPILPPPPLTRPSVAQIARENSPAPTPATSNTPPPLPKTDDSDKDVRRDERHHIPIDVSVEFLDALGNIVHKEPGLITNISKSGACVMSTHKSQVGDRVKVEMMRENFLAQAVVKAVTTGQGGVWNLHIAFLDKSWMGGS